MSAPRKLRLWPGVILVALQWILRFVVPRVAPDSGENAIMAGLALGPVILLWWLLLSRAPWKERLLVLPLMALSMFLGSQLLHPSLAGGFMGMLYGVYVIPLMGLALVTWAVLTRNVEGAPRLIALVAAMLIGGLALTLLRTGGVQDAGSEFTWRWSATPEQRLLAATTSPAVGDASALLQQGAAAWPGFRGAEGTGIVRGTTLSSDWTASPPELLWRREVGPGWSSFAVSGDVFFTQEQRGEQETVSAYRLSTGEPIWQHGDPVRFYESNAGAGPRGTPALEGNVLFTMGATGLVNALDTRDGRVLWSRNALLDSGAQQPFWGFSGSPVVDGDRVLIAAAGTLLAYARHSGELLWSTESGEGRSGYTSPVPATLQGVEQVLQLSGVGLDGYDAASGEPLWSHAWDGYPIVQPAVTRGGDVLISVRDKSGLRRLAVSRDAGEAWTVEERWTSRGLKPYFNDFVLHRGHAYGFDGSILSCIELEGGERRWKGGRYGKGQMLLLADQDLLLVLSEKGELALVAAEPDGFRELSRIEVIEGKTWNHPVLVDDLVLVRNDREMAALRLPRRD